MKAYLVYVALVLLLFGIVLNNITSHQVDSKHEQFFKDVRAFMEAKGNTNRFTSEDGKALEERIEALENELIQ